jgi:hypothetical protein
MSAQHTPGPWVVHHGRHIDAKGKNFNPALHGGKTCQECGHDESECYDEFVIGSLSVGLINDIKDGHWDDYEDSEQTSEADLHLIAAAPDLLAAAETAYKAMIAVELSDSSRAEWEAAVDRLHAAIAKATDQ